VDVEQHCQTKALEKHESHTDCPQKNDVYEEIMQPLRSKKEV